MGKAHLRAGRSGVLRMVVWSPKALRDGTPPADLAGVAPATLMNRVTRADEYEAGRKRFLAG